MKGDFFSDTKEVRQNADAGEVGVTGVNHKMFVIPEPKKGITRSNLLIHDIQL